MALKDKIKECRKKANMTQSEVGERIGVKKQTIQKYESGEITNIPYDKLVALADLFDISPATFFEDNILKPMLMVDNSYSIAPKNINTERIMKYVGLLDEEQQLLILNLVESMAKKNDKGKNS